jgi:chromosome segregation ATPase
MLFVVDVIIFMDQVEAEIKMLETSRAQEELRREQAELRLSDLKTQLDHYSDEATAISERRKKIDASIAQKGRRICG